MDESSRRNVSIVDDVTMDEPKQTEKDSIPPIATSSTDETVDDSVVASPQNAPSSTNTDTNGSPHTDMKGSQNPAEDESDPRSSNRQSLRESLRARLRAQEARLQGLVRNASGDGMESMIGQMKTVRQNLQQVEAEKTELEMELSRLKNATDDDDFLKEKMADIQDGFDKQVRKIQSLQKELDSKNDEIDSLRLELVKKLQRIVEIEFDLETHEIHYTAYAAEQFKLGEEALNEIKTSKSSENSNDDSHSSIAADGSKKFTAKKAQKLISKLLSD